MEQIKQEIINNIYENGENLITGPILQEVLLDMVDDYNGKVSSGSVPGDLVEKTGSWDDAADWVEDNSGSLVHDTDLDGYATEQWVEDQGYLKEVPEGYVTTESLNELSESVAELSSSIPSVDLSGYATTESVNEATQSVKDWVESKHYLTTASLSGSVTEESVQFMINDSTASMKEWVESQSYATETFVSESIANLDIPDTSGFVTTQSYNQDSASFDERINSISGSDLSGYATTESLNLLSESVAEDLEGKADRSDLPDLTGYATEQWVQEQGYLTEHQDISGLATTESLNQVSSSLSESIAAISASGGVDLSGYATTSSVNALSESVRSLGNQVNGFGEDLDTLNGTVAGLASTSSLNSLSESVATDIDSLEGSIGDLEQDIEDRVDWDTYNTEKAEFSQSVATDITGLSESIAAISGSDLSGYATTESLNQVSQSLSASIAAISGSGTDLSVLANPRDPDNPVFQALATASFAKWGNGKWEIDVPLEGEVEGNVDTYLNLNNVISPLQMYLLQSGIWRIYFDYDEGEDKTYWRIETQECPADIYWGDNLIGKFLQSLGLADWDDSQWYSKEPEYFTEASASFDQRINNITGSSVDLSGYATTASLNELSESLGNYLPISGGTILNDLKVTKTLRAGDNSYGTLASNPLQVFKVGVGPDNSNRRNAFEVVKGTLGSASVYVQGVGTYDGTNPQNGVNDLATVIRSISGSDLSGYATTQSLNNLSSSINTTFKLYATTSSLNTLSSSVNNTFNQYATTQSVTQLSQSISQSISQITGSAPDLSGYATTASLLATGSADNPLFKALHLVGMANYWEGPDIWTIELPEGGEGSLYEEGSPYPGLLRQLIEAGIFRYTEEDDGQGNQSWYIDLNGIAQSGNPDSPVGRFFMDKGMASWDEENETWVFNFGAPDRTNSDDATFSALHELGLVNWLPFPSPGQWVTASLSPWSRGTGTSTAQIGSYAVASGNYAIAQGQGAKAYGSSSFAQGVATNATGEGELAAGKSNFTSSGQIFSVGVGDVEVVTSSLYPGGPTIIRGYNPVNQKNAISVITGSSPSASVYIMGVGGYDGTNPQPGVNDVATVVGQGGGGGGADTVLRSFLFGNLTQSLTNISGLASNIYSEISESTTLGFDSIPDDGRSIGITVHNTAASDSVVFLPDSVTVGGVNYNLINNGADNSGSVGIPAGEYGDIVVTRKGTDLFLRTSIDVSHISVDLSGYATTASLNELSESVNELSSSIPLVDLSGYATTASVNEFSSSVGVLSASFDQRINGVYYVDSWKDWGYPQNSEILFVSESNPISNNNYDLSGNLNVSIGSIPVGHTVCANFHNLSGTTVTIGLPATNVDGKDLVYNCMPGSSSMSLLRNMWAPLVCTAINNSTILCSFPQEVI